MTHWEALVAAALLGTHRQPVPPVPGADALAALEKQIPEADKEAAVLTRAGAEALYQRIGWQPLHGRLELPARPPQDDRPVCPPKAQALLQSFLNRSAVSLLREFLDLLCEAGYRLPPVMLPEVLAKGARLAGLRPSILPILGQYGHWLASCNPNWAYASPAMSNWADMLAYWQNAALNEKQAFLQQLRAQSPETARQLLQATWRTETDKVRGTLIRHLAVGISANDEPFLEKALDDRTQVVRHRAAELLASIPSSRLCQRMKRHITHYLQWQKNGTQLRVLLPAQLPEEMLRDGFVMPKHAPTPRDISRQLTHAAGALPLSWWEESSGQPPEVVIRAVLATKWPRTLLMGLAAAVLRQKALNWLLPLLYETHFHPAAHKLVGLLPKDLFMDWWLFLREEAGDSPLSKDNPLVRMLEHWPHEWPEETAVWWLHRFAQFLETHIDDRQLTFALRVAFKRFGTTCPPRLANEAHVLLSPFLETSSVWRPAIREVLSVLKWRYQMRDSIAI